MSPLWPPFFRSLLVAAVATAAVGVVGVPLAWGLSRWRWPGKSLLQALCTLPLVLPPTVVGYLLLVLLGSQGRVTGLVVRLANGAAALLGRAGAFTAADFSITFKLPGAVLAAAVVALPLLLLPAKAAFDAIERELEDMATLMGASGWTIFWQVSVPLARRGIASGLLLAFARALGEFGATVMVLGDMDQTRTLPIYIYDESTSGLDAAGPRAAVLALIAISVLTVLIYNRLPAARREP